MGSVTRKITKGLGKLTSSVLGLEKPKSPKELDKPPVVEEPTPMPIPNDEATMAARRKSMAEQRRRHGRTSTVYTAADNDGLGG